MSKVPAPFPLYEESDREWWRWHFAGKALTGIVAGDFWKGTYEMAAQKNKPIGVLIATMCREIADHLVGELEKTNATP